MTDRDRVLDVLARLGDNWVIVQFENLPWNAWRCRRPFGIEDMVIYIAMEDGNFSHAWIPQFRHALGANSGGIYDAYDRLIHSNLLRFTKTMRNETVARRLRKLMPEYERLFQVASGNIAAMIADHRRMAETIYSVLPEAFQGKEINKSWRNTTFDLGCDHEGGKEVRWRTLEVREYEGHISRIVIEYPDQATARQIVELVLRLMPPGGEP